MKQNVLYPILNKSHCNQSTKEHMTSKTLLSLTCARRTKKRKGGIISIYGSSDGDVLGIVGLFGSSKGTGESSIVLSGFSHYPFNSQRRKDIKEEA